MNVTLALQFGSTFAFPDYFCYKLFPTFWREPQELVLLAFSKYCMSSTVLVFNWLVGGLHLIVSTDQAVHTTYCCSPTVQYC